MKKTSSLFFCLLIGALFIPSSAEAGWYINSRGRLAYEFDGDVLGKTIAYGDDYVWEAEKEKDYSEKKEYEEEKNEVKYEKVYFEEKNYDKYEKEIDYDEAEQAFKKLLDSSSSGSSAFFSSDSEELKALFTQLLNNVEITTNASGQLEAKVVDPVTGITSTVSVTDEGSVVSEVVKEDGTVETTVYDNKDIEEKFGTIIESVEAEKITGVEPSVIKLDATKEGVAVEVETIEGPSQVVEKVFEIEQHKDANTVKVISPKEGSVVFTQGKFGAQTDHKVAVDTLTNDLLLTTDKGEQRVSFLPTAAVSSLLVDDIIDEVDTNAVVDAAVKDSLPEVDSVIELVDHKKGLAYEVNGIKKEKVFGLIPVEIEKTAHVSAETGEVYDVQVDLSDRVKDWFSF